MKKVRYIGFFALPERHSGRVFYLSATNKMAYICKTLNKIGRNVDIVSLSDSDRPARGERLTIFGGKKDGNATPTKAKTRLKLFRSFGKKGKIARFWNKKGFRRAFAVYMALRAKKNDPVIVYHTPHFIPTIIALKRWKKFRLILEVEEIYADVNGCERTRALEKQIFAAADAFIFSTELLDEKLNVDKKPSVVIYGTYQVEPELPKREFFDEPTPRKRLLYAGTLEPHKGASAVVAAAAFLPTDYRVHILGFGSDEDKARLRAEIEKSSENGGAKVSLDGLLSGDEFLRFVQSCDVGLSAQASDAPFNDTSFPSKTTSYLSNGLRVVSVRTPALERSAVANVLNFYDGDDPKSIADAVLNVDWETPYDGRDVVRQLDEKFARELAELLGDA